MAARGAAHDWLDDVDARIRNIAEGLLTIEVNTVEKPSMSAEKMPDVPLALHDIVSMYNDFLEHFGFAPDRVLQDLAAQRLALLRQPPPGETDAVETALINWVPTRDLPDLTNGEQSFEALQWAATVALKALGARNATGARRAAPGDLDPEVPGKLERIRSNSIQLREAAILLERDHNTGDPAKYMFGVSRDRSVHALLNDPKPPLRVAPDVLVLIRKIWDIGVETVLMQTAIQIDGDLIQRVSPTLDPGKRDFIAGLHGSAVKSGVQQWQTLFDLAKSLITGVGQAIFGFRA